MNTKRIILLLLAVIFILSGCAEKAPATPDTSPSAVPADSIDGTGSTDVSEPPDEQPEEPLELSEVKSDTFAVAPEYQDIFAQIHKALMPSIASAYGDDATIVPAISVLDEVETENGPELFYVVQYAVLSNYFAAEDCLTVDSSTVHVDIGKIYDEGQNLICLRSRETSVKSWEERIYEMCNGDSALAGSLLNGTAALTPITPPLSEMLTAYFKENNIEYISYYQGNDTSLQHYIAQISAVEGILSRATPDELATLTELVKADTAEILNEHPGIFDSLDIVSIDDRTHEKIWELKIDPTTYDCRVLQVIRDAQFKPGAAYGNWETSGNKTTYFYFEKETADSEWHIRDYGHY